MPLQYIAAVTVNHNTSRYMELMLRSLVEKHPTGLDLSVTVFDNGSMDLPQSDTLHFDTGGQIELGKRFAQAYLLRATGNLVAIPQT